ncbi:glutamine synthetase family protein [Photobacterium satsumensis]|uniref:glutamine synthetase family protein n=1 Tax=Photobacterium satsumensis TaxID=2910239 RepID=UPI003D0B98F2
MDAFDSEVRNFLQKWPEIEFVDLVFTDINACPRGKRIPIKALGKVKKGVPLPVSTISLNMAGSVVEEAGLGEELGEPDHLCFPIANTLTRTVNPNVAQLLLTMMDASGEKPTSLFIRNVLEDLQKQLHSKGQFPVVALELEFYLVDKSRMENGLVKPAFNPKKRMQERDTAVYDIENLDDYADFLSDLNTAAAEQELNTSGALSESAPGQFELNFNHQQDVLNACDQVLLAKRLIRQVAHLHNFDVTFMAKPFAHEAGNGQHIHLSVVDEAGRNLFSDRNGAASPFFYQTLAAMIHAVPSSIALLCPNVNSYRRFSARSYTPTKADWGHNHRGVALRIPMSDSNNRRIEHRIAGADVNPYILASVVLANVLAAETFTPEQCPEVLSETAPSIPTRMSDALTELERGEFGNYLPTEFLHIYHACKQSELAEFESAVTPLEVEWMLHSA